LLALSKLTRCEMRHTRVELSVMAREIAEELRRAEPGRNVDVTIQPDLTDEGDEPLLRNVLYNLLGNAFKFTRTRETACIEFGASTGETERTFFVKDNGVGFDPEQAGRLFSPFQRLHRPQEFPGHGIGLVSCRRALARHGGRIWAEAWPGAGACFRFTLGG
jgi:light-regulated signal transduction histidine kinase (bacteriophytochrome)